MPKEAAKTSKVVLWEIRLQTEESSGRGTAFLLLFVFVISLLVLILVRLYYAPLQ